MKITHEGQRSYEEGYPRASVYAGIHLPAEVDPSGR
jgi:hypothetical protein